MGTVNVYAIVVPIYNRLQVTREGLKYIMAAVSNYTRSSLRPAAIEVIVVDDGSTDGSKEWIAQNYPQIRILVGTGDLWWTGSVNMGIEFALNRFANLRGVILQNDDVALDPEWLINYIHDIESHPQSLIGCATSTLDSKDRILYGGRQMHAWFAREKKINHLEPREKLSKDYTVTSFDLYGRGLFIPTSVFHEVGLFDQIRFKHRGDMDIPLRAKKQGYKLLVSYGAIVYELPQFAYNLDGKQRLTFKEAYTLLTDFRSSYSLRHIYYYSLIATKNAFHFLPFFAGNLYFHVRNVCWRVCKNYLLSSSGNIG